VRVFVEREAIVGEAVTIDALRDHLQAADPPISAFTIAAQRNVPWGDFVRAASVAACYDRAPGGEPHEVIWDQRRLVTPPPAGG
jgi:hypothetical protein